MNEKEIKKRNIEARKSQDLAVEAAKKAALEAEDKAVWVQFAAGVICDATVGLFDEKLLMADRFLVAYRERRKAGCFIDEEA